ncbi:MAG: hypothetical protein Q9228_005871 [Teloschistes exilis]
MAARLIYEPLRHERCFRLLNFDTQTADSSIRCTMSEYGLDDNIKYSALSYTWGPPESPDACDSQKYQQYKDERYDIFVNDTLLAIGLNLRDALIRLRRSDPDLVLWVDAVCINQNDLSERSSQVNAMGDIYGNCTQVIVWLGEEQPDTRDTVDFIQTIAHASKAQDEDGKLLDWRGSEARAARGLPPATADQWEALLFLYYRRWFERLWVVQEVTLPKNTTAGSGIRIGSSPSITPIGQHYEAIRMICGSVTIAWGELLDCANYLLGSGMIQKLVISGNLGKFLKYKAEFGMKFQSVSEFVMKFQSLSELRSLRVMCYGASTSTHNPRTIWHRAFGLKHGVYDPSVQFCYFRMILRHWCCADPKDKVYAILGLLDRIRYTFNPNELPFMVADYAKTVEEIYREATTTILLHSGRLDVLQIISDPSLRNYPNLPSWVDDYSAIRESSILKFGSKEGGPFTFDAAKGHVYANLSFCDGGKILQLHGSRIGHVDEIGEANSHWVSELSDLFWEASAKLVLKCDETYINGQSRVEAWWRTLITDQTITCYPAPDSMGPLFFNHLRAIFKKSILRQIAKGDRTEVIMSRNLPYVEKLAQLDATGQMPSVHGEVESCLEIEGRSLDEAATEVRKNMVAFYENTKIFLHLRLFRTGNNLLGMGPRNVAEGDEVWLLQGARVPFVLRPNLENGRYQLIGQSYVHGMMHGEALEMEGFKWSGVELE